VIANSRVRDNVESWYPPGNPIGRDNLVRGNCVNGAAADDGSDGISDQRGFKVVETVRARPDYASRSARDFRLEAGNPCRDVLAAYRTTVPGPDGVTGSPHAQRHVPAVTLGALRDQIQRGHRLPMIGRVASTRLRPGLRVVVVARVHGQRHLLARVPVSRDGTFSLRPRVRGTRGARFVRVQAVVRGVGRSRSIRVRLR
jgi:hypothetical protein